MNPCSRFHQHLPWRGTRRGAKIQAAILAVRQSGAVLSRRKLQTHQPKRYATVALILIVTVHSTLPIPGVQQQAGGWDLIETDLPLLWSAKTVTPQLQILEQVRRGPILAMEFPSTTRLLFPSGAHRRTKPQILIPSPASTHLEEPRYIMTL